MVAPKNSFNFSYSGLKTSVINLVHNEKAKGNEIDINDLACSFQTIAMARNMQIGNRDSFPWAMKRRRIMILPSSHASVKKCTRVQHPLVGESGNEGGSMRTIEG